MRSAEVGAVTGAQGEAVRRTRQNRAGAARPRRAASSARARHGWQQTLGLARALGLFSSLIACAPSPDDGERAAETPGGEAAGGPAPRPVLCERPGDDAVRDVFCAAPAPEVASLEQLLAELGVAPPDLTTQRPAAMPGYYGKPMNMPVLLGLSTALSGRLISPINPRAIVLGDKTVLAFQRGVQQVELATLARDTGRLNFYLLEFTQACNQGPGGCAPGDLYTPRIEADWKAVALRDDEDLKNTPSDCRQCHQRARERPLLLMRELEGPWTHFFAPDPERPPEDPYPDATGGDLVRDYLRAKGDERYAAMPPQLIRGTIGLLLEARMELPQPLVFDGQTIHAERWPHDGQNWPAEPSRSPTWDAAYAAFKRGEQLPLPHFQQRATDPAKQARLTDAYARYVEGTLPAEELPELSDIFPDDPQTRAEIGLETEPGASPADALIQACASCHSDALDQTLSRARFSVALSRMDRAERERAIERLELPADAPGAMPPREARALPSSARAQLIAYLRREARPAEDDARLDHAASHGMTGTSP